MEAIAYDERGLVPCVIQDARTGEVLTLAYMNAEALRRTRGDRRAAPVEPLARRAVAQGRDLGQHPGRARAALRLRRRRRARARRPRRPGLPHRRAHAASTTATSTLTDARGAARAGAHDRRARRRRRRGGLLHRPAARRPAVRGREGAGGGRGGRPRRARGVRRARRRGGRRRALPPDRAAAHARAGAWPTPRGCCLPVAADQLRGHAGRRGGARARRRAQPDPGHATRSSRTARRPSPRS